MNRINISNFFNYTIRGLIILVLVYLYLKGSLTLNRVLIFWMVFLMIYGYSRVSLLIYNIFLNKKVKKYVEDHKENFFKILYVLLDIHRWINPFIVFLAYTDECLYRINRYITSTRFVHYNFVIYVLMKYYVMFGLIKLLIYKYYNFWYKLSRLTIIEILFKRMYGLILSILIFTDLFNNVINLLIQYSIWIYIIVYYAIATLCIIWELFYYYYYIYIPEFKKPKYKKLVYFIILIQTNFQDFTKMNVILFLRSQFTWLGNILNCLLGVVVADVDNLKKDFMHLTKVSESGYFMSGRINYYIPLDTYISFKYFKYLGGYLDFGYFERTFELYWKCFIADLCYYSFFAPKPISEIKYKPSKFLYQNIQQLANLDGIENQPINRLMNWNYFEIKYKENFNNFKKDEKLIINQNLSYFKKVDNLRAKLIFFILWDIEYFYLNDKDYCWYYWILQYDSIIEHLNFTIDISKNSNITYNWIYNNKRLLKFYDPEENMEFLNRLFNVLGIVNISTGIVIIKKYYVSKKFINYNNKYVELLRIMYTYDYKRWEEPMCECKYLSNYEVEIGYKTEDYIQNLRKEWEISIKTEKLEERNYRLLKCLEDLMDKR